MVDAPLTRSYSIRPNHDVKGNFGEVGARPRFKAIPDNNSEDSESRAQVRDHLSISKFLEQVALAALVRGGRPRSRAQSPVILSLGLGRETGRLVLSADQSLLDDYDLSIFPLLLDQNDDACRGDDLMGAGVRARSPRHLSVKLRVAGIPFRRLRLEARDVDQHVAVFGLFVDGHFAARIRRSSILRVRRKDGQDIDEDPDQSALNDFAVQHALLLSYELMDSGRV